MMKCQSGNVVETSRAFFDEISTKAHLQGRFLRVFQGGRQAIHRETRFGTTALFHVGVDAIEAQRSHLLKQISNPSGAVATTEQGCVLWEHEAEAPILLRVQLQGCL